MDIFNYSNEIQIEIDDVYGCPGHCPGCVLSNIERKNYSPDMSFNILETTINKLIEYVPTLKGLEKINLTYGIGDHFLMSNDYLEKTYHLGADLIEKTNLKNQYNGIFYTTSMIGKHEDIMNKVSYLHNISKKRGVPFYIIAVLDPKNLYHKKFGEIYSKNIVNTNKLIGRVDLSINLSEEAVDKISPQELYEFAKLNEFDEVTINWVPTNDNIEFVYFNQKKLSTWLIEFDNLIEADGKMSTSYSPVIEKTINSLMCKSDSYINDFSTQLKLHLPELVNKSIQIDHLGNVFPKYEAIGDIAHNPRIGIEAWGNVMNSQSLKQLIDTGHKKTEKFVLKQFTKGPCLDCSYNKFCANSGFHIYNHILSNNKDINTALKVRENIKITDCYHSGKNLFNHYYNKLEKKHREG